MRVGWNVEIAIKEDSQDLGGENGWVLRGWWRISRFGFGAR